MRSLICCVLFLGALSVEAAAAAELSVRPKVEGGLRVAGNRLVDAAGRTILLQASETPLDLPLAYAGTMFSTLRQRWNMNAVRLAVSVDRSERAPGYILEVAEMVRRANQAELFVILAPHEADEPPLPTARTLAFWKKWAAFFRDYPLVGFSLFAETDAGAVPGHRPGVRRDADWQAWHAAMQPAAEAIRATGARQIILAMAFEDELLLEGFGERWFLTVPDVVYEICPMSRAHSTDAARNRTFGFLAPRVPLMAVGWDPELNRAGSDECASIPRSPRDAARLMRSHMEYFDAHAISWSASSFTPGKLIFSLVSMEPTELYKDVVCGAVENPVQGIGLEVQLHQWGLTAENLISVSAGAGAIEIAQGGIGVGYALVTPTPEAAASWPLPTALGGVSLRITDAAGIARLAPLLYAGIGSINFLVDPATAPGLARTELVRANGEAGPAGSIIVSPVAPGLFSATMNARGPVVGVAVQKAGGPSTPLFECGEFPNCWTLPVDVAQDGSTELHLYGTGFRNTSNLRATIGGHHVHIAETGPQPGVPYNDRLVLQLRPELAGLGEEDLVFWADSRVSNVVRVRLR